VSSTSLRSTALTLSLLFAPALHAELPWPTTTPPEHIAMMSAVRNAVEALPMGALQRFELSEADRQILLRAQNEIDDVPHQAFEQRAKLCAAVIRGDYLSSDSAPALAQQLSSIDQLYSKAASTYFDQVIAQLSPQGAQAVQLLKTRILALTRASAVDWNAYALEQPAELVNTVYSACRPQEVQRRDN